MACGCGGGAGTCGCSGAAVGTLLPSSQAVGAGLLLPRRTPASRASQERCDCGKSIPPADEAGRRGATKQAAGIPSPLKAADGRAGCPCGPESEGLPWLDKGREWRPAAEGAGVRLPALPTIKCGEEADGHLPAWPNVFRKPDPAHAREVLLVPGACLPLDSASFQTAIGDAVAQAHRQLGCILRPKGGEEALHAQGKARSASVATRHTLFGAMAKSASASTKSAARPEVWEEVTGGIFRKEGFLSCSIRMRYRDQEYFVPCDWYAEYVLDLAGLYGEADESVGNGLVSSVDDALDILWGRFRQRSRSTAGRFGSLLGCYNLPQEGFGSEGVYFKFWSANGEAPYQAYLATMDLILTYYEFLDLEGTVHPDVSDTCAGFDTFVRTLLEGKSASRAEDSVASGAKDSCTVQINFRSFDPFEAKMINPPCEGDDPECWAGYILNDESFCPGISWNAWKWEWMEQDSSGNTVRCFTGNNAGSCGRPDALCKTLGYAGTWRITLHASHLAYIGRLCDEILFRARMSYITRLRAVHPLKWGSGRLGCLRRNGITDRALRPLCADAYGNPDHSRTWACISREWPLCQRSSLLLRPGIRGLEV